jgi:hypothetical protein
MPQYYTAKNQYGACALNFKTLKINSLLRVLADPPHLATRTYLFRLSFPFLDVTEGLKVSKNGDTPFNRMPIVSLLFCYIG